MSSFLGVVLLIAGGALIVSAFRRRDPAAAAGPSRAHLWGGLACAVVGLLLALQPALAMARLSPVELSRKDNWRSHPAVGADAPIKWEGSVLVADLEAGSGHYAVYPVDWEANRFEASWDITFTHLDLPGQKIELTFDGKPETRQRTRRDFASVSVGLMDQSIVNIDDRDHVSGSALEACFSDDIRLRASDANYIVRTSSATESGKLELDPTFQKGAPFAIALNTPYHCRLTYDRGSKDAVLEVRDDAGSRITRRLEDLKDFTNSVSWFGVSVRGYNRFDKKLDPKKADNGYTRPRVVVRIEKLEDAQPS